jgi:cell division protein ZapB
MLLRVAASLRPLTVNRLRSIVTPMTSKQINSAQKLDLDLLALRVEELIRLCDRLREENNRLKATQTQLQAAQARLTDKNQLSRTKLESMITRLKILEVEL